MIHYKDATGWKTEFLGTGIVMHHSDNVESEEEAEACFEDLDNFHPAAVMGSCFHLIQQLGGKMTVKGWEVGPCSITDCGGKPLEEHAVVSIRHPSWPEERDQVMYFSEMKFRF